MAGGSQDYPNASPAGTKSGRFAALRDSTPRRLEPASSFGPPDKFSRELRPANQKCRTQGIRIGSEWGHDGGRV